MINQYFCKQLTELDYATVAACTIKKDFSVIRYANAGHIPPILIPSTNEPLSELPIGKFPIGMMKESSYESTEIPIRAGDKLFLYTDGLVEICNKEGKRFGYKGLMNTLNSCRSLSTPSIIQRIVDEVKNYSWQNAIIDDITCLAVEF
jgi:serine phosphatase RsbU (regulator of sigma subunit)